MTRDRLAGEADEANMIAFPHRRARSLRRNVVGVAVRRGPDLLCPAAVAALVIFGGMAVALGVPANALREWHNAVLRCEWLEDTNAVRTNDSRKF